MDAETGYRSRAAPPPQGSARDNGLWLVAGLMALYSALHVGFRLAASSALGEDDPIKNILVQDLRWTYDARQPPLYDWLLYAVQQVTGPGIGGFLLVKYGALIATGLFLYATARRAFGAGTLALMSVESLALIYQLSWRYHEGYTHQVGTMVAVAATMWAALRALDCARGTDFVVLGIVAGLGLLTQPIFALFLLSLAVAIAWEGEARARLSAGWLVVAVVIALGMGLLHVWPNAGALAADAGQVRSPSLRDAAGGFWNALRAPLFYLSPLVLILPVLFNGLVLRLWLDLTKVTAGPRRQPAPGDPALHERIILRSSVVGLVLSVLGATALGLRGHASHVFMPLYITAVVWLMGAVRRSEPSAVALSRFARLALAIAVVALVGRLANMFVLDPVCKICRWGVPYQGLAAEIARTSAPGAPIVVVDHELGGNLRAAMPDRRIVLARGGALLPKGTRIDGFATAPVLVWSATTGDAAVREAIALTGVAADPSKASEVRVPWRHLWRPTGYRESRWLVLDTKGLARR